MDLSYIYVLALVLIISPFVLFVSSKKDKKIKSNLRLIFFMLLAFQLISGFLNWETFRGMGRSGYELSLTYPQSILGLFFVISALQILLLILNIYKFSLFAVILNFANTVILLAGVIRLSNMLGYQAVSLFSIAAVFMVLISNVVALMFINKNKALLKKYFK